MPIATIAKWRSTSGSIGRTRASAATVAPTINNVWSAYDTGTEDATAVRRGARCAAGTRSRERPVPAQKGRSGRRCCRRKEALLRLRLPRRVVHVAAIAARDQAARGVEGGVVAAQSATGGLGSRARRECDGEGDRQGDRDRDGHLVQPRRAERVGRKGVSGDARCGIRIAGGRRCRCRERHMVSSAPSGPG